MNKVLFSSLLVFSCLSMSDNIIEAAISWSSPENLSVAGKDAVGGKVVIDSSGNTVAAWSRYDGAYFTVQSISKQFKGNWGKRIDLSDHNSNGLYINLNSDHLANTIAIWSYFGKKENGIDANLCKFGSGWGASKEVDGSASSNVMAYPQCAFDQQGNAVAVWLANESGHNIIKSATKLYGKQWKDPVNVISFSATGQINIRPKVALDQQGNAVAVWVNPDTLAIQSAIKPLSSNWSKPIVLSANQLPIDQPQIGIDPFGNATAVWSRNDGSNYTIQASTKLYTGQWMPPVNLSSAGQDAFAPQIAVDNSGTVVAIWYRSNGSTTVIETASMPLGGQWSTVSDLSDPSQDASDPQIKIAANGDAIAAWKISNGQNFVIQAVQKPYKSTWQIPVTLSQPGQDAVNPQLAVDSYGNGIALWQRSDGANSIVQASFGQKM